MAGAGFSAEPAHSGGILTSSSSISHPAAVTEAEAESPTDSDSDMSISWGQIHAPNVAFSGDADAARPSGHGNCNCNRGHTEYNFFSYKFLFCYGEYVQP
jgi:hypothetical protein